MWLTGTHGRGHNSFLFTDMFIAKSKQIHDEVLNHWIASADNFAYNPQEFYEQVKRQLAAIKVPGLEVSQVDYAEGGILSSNRVYLRLIRERLAFDICAAPFGTRYFFSCRTVYSPAMLKLSDLVFMLIYAAILWQLLFSYLGFYLGMLALLGIFLTLGTMLQTVVAKGLADIDAALLKIPGLGPVYERFFRKETYYRQDTRMMYLDTIPALVQAVADEITGSKGVKLIREYQTAPILGDLYKPLPPRSPARAEK